MAIYYKVYQSNRKNSPSKGKWFGRIKYVGTITDDELADRIEEKCTVHKADVKAVLTALVGEISASLRDSYRVHLIGLGTFKIGMATTPADERDKFTPANIKGVHVLFMPETHVDASTKKHTRAMTADVRFKGFSQLEASVNEQSPEKGGGTAGGGTTGGGTTGGGSTGGDLDA